MKYFLVFLLSFCIVMNADAQLYAGAGLGSFHVRGNSDKVKGAGPYIELSYVGDDNERQAGFLSFAVYPTKVKGGKAYIDDGFGGTIGEANKTVIYNIKHLQLGFKAALAGNFDDTRVCWSMGGGIALSFVNTTFKYDLPGYKIEDEKINRTLYGFHFNSALQCKVKKFVIGVRGNFDFMLKPIEIAGGDNHSYFLTSTQIGVSYPIFTPKDF